MKIARILLTGFQILSLTSATLHTAIWFPNAPITEFYAYLLVPPTSSSTMTPNSSQSIYIALQPTNPSLLQLPVRNINSSWWLEPAWCCDTTNNAWAAPTQLYDAQHTYPANSLYLSFIPVASKWSLAWGNAAANQPAGTKSALVDFDPSGHSLQGSFTKAIFSLEILDGADWDFGDVTWTNISIVATTTDSSWCSQPITSNVGYGFDSTALNGEGQVSCNIPSLTFKSSTSK